MALAWKVLQRVKCNDDDWAILTLWTKSIIWFWSWAKYSVWRFTININIVSYYIHFNEEWGLNIDMQLTNNKGKPDMKFIHGSIRKKIILFSFDRQHAIMHCKMPSILKSWFQHCSIAFESCSYRLIYFT